MLHNPSRLLSGRDPFFFILIQLADIYGLTLDELVGRRPFQKNPDTAIAPFEDAESL